MADDHDRRIYDLLRLIKEHEPIGSIRLVDRMQQHGYSITGRTVRFLLSELDDQGLTEKVPGRGRRLTDAGRSELTRGNVHGRLEQIRSRIATLASQATYDASLDEGTIVVSSILVEESTLSDVRYELETLSTSRLGPVRVGCEKLSTDGLVRLLIPSSVTLDCVFRENGINVDLRAAGLVEYHPDSEASPYDDPEPGPMGGAVVRYIDATDGATGTIDIIELLIEAGRTDVNGFLDGNVPAPIVVDNREIPLVHFSTAATLAGTVRDRFGGVVDMRRPRENGPFPLGDPGWDFASITYAGPGELALALLVENDLAVEWTALSSVVDVDQLGSVDEL